MILYIIYSRISYLKQFLLERHFKLAQFALSFAVCRIYIENENPLQEKFTGP